MLSKDEIKQLSDEILRLKKEKDALILAHYYQRLEIQQVADIFGDSFELSKKAKLAENRLVVFCGVRFMAESAKILNPDKKVLLPAVDAGCPMADMVTPEDVLELRAKYPEAAVVCYVNSSAETKAVSDICCTSSNAIKVVKSLPNRQIIFVPDKNLGAYVAKFVPEKEFILHSGFCPTHRNITAAEVDKAKAEHPNALFAVHPECEDEVVAKADFVGSTSQIIDYCVNTDAPEFIIGTEVGVVDRLAYYHPEKKYHLLTPYLVCPNMKKTELSDVLAVLRDESNEVIMTQEEIEAAKAPLERMVAIK
ncbi:MAG: quinolinate synthase NadA [Clostridiales bacterium]|nr:quinolinate synthase NadA [Clostridiales bacterium]